MSPSSNTDSPPAFSKTTIENAEASSFASMFSSLSAQFTQTTGEVPGPNTPPSPPTSKSTRSSQSTSTAPSTTFTTSTTPSAAISSAPRSSPFSAASTAVSGSASAAASGSATNSAPTNAASSAASTDANTVSKADSCSGISCSAGLQAAVAVPVVLAVLGILALLFFFVRRRRRNTPADETMMKRQPSKKKWTRHLRVFSFDAELLMGGRFSSTNSIRSRQTRSLRSGQGSVHSAHPSLHSIDEVAPPYRDAISHAQPPNMTQTTGSGAFPVAAINGDTTQRSSSRATAPPPYAAAGGAAPRSPTTPTSGRNPFSDSPLVSPVEGSPFNDPPEEAGSILSTPSISRNSSMYHSVRLDDASTLAGASDAGSVREAQVARNMSVMSGGRTIDDIRRSS